MTKGENGCVMVIVFRLIIYTTVVVSLFSDRQGGWSNATHTERGGSKNKNTTSLHTPPTKQPTATRVVARQ